MRLAVWVACAFGVLAAAAGCTQRDLSASGAPREQGRDHLTLHLGDGATIEVALVNAGEFMMGSAEGDGDERPVHRTRITRSFYMGVTEVTVGQYRAFLLDGGDDSGVVWSSELCPLRRDETYSLSDSEFGQDHAQPMMSVGWEGIQAFCQWLSQKTGRTVRLPTEAEWEYACRAGSTTAYCFGDSADALPDYAWCSENAGWRTHPVAQKEPNAWGLYDMHGNVWESCQDGYDSHCYENSAAEDPMVPSDHSERCDLVQFRVLRGGAWYLPARYCRSANRYAYDVRFQNEYAFGFRVVVSATR